MTFVAASAGYVPRHGNAVVALFAALILSGCAAPPPAPSALEQQAVSLNRRAAQAFEQGDLARARAHYEQALRLVTAIENAQGIAANALSLAQVLQASGEFDAAHRTLDALLAGATAARLPPERGAEALARKAQMYFRSADIARATQFADRALSLCADCAALAAILNLRGRIALEAGDAAGALAWAGKAFGIEARGGGDEKYDARIERANSLRLTGEARMRRGEYALAVEPMEQALALDRVLGLPTRIHRDLMALGRAQVALGNRDAAAAYYGRARSVSAAANNEAGSREAIHELDQLGHSAGAR